MEEVEEVEGTVSLQGSGRTGSLIALPGKMSVFILFYGNDNENIPICSSTPLE